MLWKVPKIWDNQECWILGGGASFIDQFEIPKDIVAKVRAGELSPAAYSPYLSKIHNKRVIAINSAFLIGNWIDICFFGDNTWYDDYKIYFPSFAGLIVGAAPKLLAEPDKYVKNLKRSQNHYGIASNPSTVNFNFNSGAASISLCHHLGVKRIILVGFDMGLSKEGQKHWHNLYAPASVTAFGSHIVGFEQIAIDAKNLGIEIINASLVSNIKQFEKVPVKDLL